MIPFVILFIIIAVAVFLLSVSTYEPFFVYMSSIIITLCGIYILVNGLLEFNNWLTNAFGTLLVGSGMYVMVMASLSQISQFE